MNHDESKNRFTERGINSNSLDFQSYRSPMNRSYAKVGSMTFDFPQLSSMSSIQKSQDFVESHNRNPAEANRNFLSELRSQHRTDQQVSQVIPVNYGSTSSSSDKDNQTRSSTRWNQSMSTGEDTVKMVVAPVQSVQRSFTKTEEDTSDSHHEEKTVTIKRKITRRKKGSEKINTLRDSYIDSIGSPLPAYDTTSDTDESQFGATTVRSSQAVSEVIPLKQAMTNERPPTIFITSPPEVNHEIIAPQMKKGAESGALLAFLNQPVEKSWPSNDEIAQETFINERQTAPVSSYSARKENMKSQQIVDDRNLGSRISQSERSIGNRNEMTEEIETITLQPIGKGVQDLATPQSATLSRPISRAATPKLFDSGAGSIRSNYYHEESKQMGGYNTTNSTPKFSKTYSVRNVNQTPNYDLTDSYNHGGSVHRLSNEQSHMSSFQRSSNEQNPKPSFNRASNGQSQRASVNRVVNDQVNLTSFGRGLNQQAPAPSFNRVATEHTVGSMSNRAGNEHTIGSMSNRAANEQTINSSWHTRTESYGGGNRAYQYPMSPVANQDGMMSNVLAMSAGDDHLYNLQMVLNSEEQWYQPHYSRDDVINALRDKEPGSFYIRSSSTFEKAYGLAMKVIALPSHAVRTNDSQGDLVRHFLIETVEDSSNTGVRLKGFTTESVYPSLAHFVHAHCQNAMALPHRLVLPHTQLTGIDQVDGMVAQSHSQYESHQGQQQMGSANVQLLSKSNSQYQNHQGQLQMGSGKAQMLSQSHRSLSSPGVNFTSINHPNPLHQYYKINAMYLGKVEIDRLKTEDAIEHAVDKIMSKLPRKTTTVEIQLDSTKGITLNDKMQKMFYTRKIPAQHVLYAGFDPKQREFSSPVLQNNGINRGRIMGIVVKKQNIILKENAVHLFCEMDNSNNISDVITFVNGNYTRLP